MPNLALIGEGVGTVQEHPKGENLLFKIGISAVFELFFAAHRRQ